MRVKSCSGMVLHCTLSQMCQWQWGLAYVITLLFIECHEGFCKVQNPVHYGPRSYPWYQWSHYERHYGHFPEEQRLHMLEEAKKMFYFGYENYMTHAFPQDELNPIYCSGRGPDQDNLDNININDVLGDYCLTLIDTLDTLAILGNGTEFKKAVERVISNANFDKNNTVQVFEANIRILGGLLSAHQIITDPQQELGDMRPDDYNDELLHLAHDLANRLLPAFENTETGIPHPRVNLRQGLPEQDKLLNETCTAGAGSLVLEFGILSRLLGDPIFETSARRASHALWRNRHNNTGLLGNVIDIQTGKWLGQQAGLGAGMDSYYEYLFKTYILFGELEDLSMFNECYDKIKHFMRRGRERCNSGGGDHPLYVNVNMNDGSTLNSWIDALQAAFSGLQVLSGDIEEAICSHALYYALWKKYGVLPERYNWMMKAPDVKFYPLRPELVESTYLLYQVTKSPFYLHVGRDILTNLNKYAKAECGYATIHSVDDMSQEDRMESFFLSETCKYLYLLFDTGHVLNTRSAKDYMFSTEGHLFRITRELRQPSWMSGDDAENLGPDWWKTWRDVTAREPTPESVPPRTNRTSSCDQAGIGSEHTLPLQSRYLQQLDLSLGVPIPEF